MTDDEVAARILAGDRRIAARLISRAEAGDAALGPLLGQLYRAGRGTPVIGVTGPPGAGKSTLVDGLISAWRGQGRRVAVLAVDPSSPLTGGAVLGDRVRMARHAADPDVLIRSMGARGALGGLANAAGDAVTVLDAMGFDVIVLETVGVGQSEVEVLAHADCVLLLQTPQGGDGIQAVKAGVLEVADLLVVNKADVAGAERTLRDLREMIAHRTPTIAGWDAPVIAAVASRGDGVPAVVAAIDRFLAIPSAQRRQRSERRIGLRVLGLAQLLLRRRMERGEGLAGMAALIAGVVDRASDPYAAASRLIDGARTANMVESCL